MGALLLEPQQPLASDSEFDLCLIEQSRVPPHFHHKLTMLNIDRKSQYHHFESYSSEDASQFAESAAEAHVSQFDGTFGSLWVDAGRVTGHSALWSPSTYKITPPLPGGPENSLAVQPHPIASTSTNQIPINIATERRCVRRP